MKKIQISLSAANPFLAADGMIDTVAAARLAGKIATANKKFEAANDTGKPLKAASLIIYSRKPLAKYAANLDKKRDHKYLLLRAQQLKTRTRMPGADTRVKIVTLMPALYGDDKSLLAEIKKFTSACTQHNRKAESLATKVGAEKAKIRDAAEAEFAENTEQLLSILQEHGAIKEANIVQAKGMFGTSVLVKLPNGGVVSIGKSDMAKFRAAKKAATSESSDSLSSHGKLTLAEIKAAMGKDWPTLSKWIAQEKKEQDSCDFYTSNDETVHQVGYKLFDILFEAGVKSVKDSPEPYRAAIDYAVSAR